MKNLFCIALFISVLMISCKKENQSSQTSALSSNATADTCTATLTDAEYINIFPADNHWNKNLTKLAVDSLSSQIIANFCSSGLHADFGSGNYDGAPIGIPYVVICGSQQKYNVVFRANSYDGNYGD